MCSVQSLSVWWESANSDTWKKVFNASYVVFGSREDSICLKRLLISLLVRDSLQECVCENAWPEPYDAHQTAGVTSKMSMFKEDLL